MTIIQQNGPHIVRRALQELVAGPPANHLQRNLNLTLLDQDLEFPLTAQKKPLGTTLLFKVVGTILLAILLSLHLIRKLEILLQQPQLTQMRRVVTTTREILELDSNNQRRLKTRVYIPLGVGNKNNLLIIPRVVLPSLYFQKHVAVTQPVRTGPCQVPP